ncbi:TatD family hydrolase [Peribacillus sp. SCS-26]|uniref:TatD family hydrolase n=1 Tax=Paraperibacillus marinus TaxID=3115295 RepID=UPI003905DC6E
MNYIDAHIHLDLYEKKQQEEIIGSLEYSGGFTGMIAVSMNLASSKQNLGLSRINPAVHPAFGWHPEQTLPARHEQDELLGWLRQNADRMTAVGEVGLPHYLNQEKTLDYKPYLVLLEEFILLAKELDKPLVLHAVYEDADLVCGLLDQHHYHKAHFHWFKGNSSTVRKLADRGCYISFTPDILYESEIRELAAFYPLDRIMAETDGPWPFEGPFSGKHTHPSFIPAVIDEIAKLKKVETAAAAEQIYKNTTTFYQLIK